MPLSEVSAVTNLHGFIVFHEYRAQLSVQFKEDLSFPSLRQIAFSQNDYVQCLSSFNLNLADKMSNRTVL